MSYNNEFYPLHIWLIGGIDHDNLGDHFIELAMNVFLNDCLNDLIIHEILIKNYYLQKEYLLDSILPNDVIVFCGGGNLGDLWPRLENLRRDVFTTWPDNYKIVFPQSVYFDDVEQLNISKSIYHGDKCFLALRDQMSFDIAKKNFDCNLFLVPDIVMYYEVNHSPKDRSDVLLMLREDKESYLNYDDRKNIFDILKERFHTVLEASTVIDHSIVDSEQRKKELNALVNKISSKRLVVTDRLHAMIISAITSTPCIVFSNSYHKIKYFMSWLNDLEYIRFVDSVDDLDKTIQEIDLSKEYEYPLYQKRELFSSFHNAVTDILEKNRIKKRKVEYCISLVIFYKGNSKKLKECLECIKYQSLPETETICIYGSQCDSVFLNDSLKADKCTKFIKIDNTCFSEELSSIIKQAKGEYVIFLSEENQLEKNALKETFEAMEEKNLDVLCLNGDIFEENGYKSIEKCLFSGKEFLSLIQSNENIFDLRFAYKKELIDVLPSFDVKQRGVINIDMIYRILYHAKRAGVIKKIFFSDKKEEINKGKLVSSFEDVENNLHLAKEAYKCLNETQDGVFVKNQLNWIEEKVLKKTREIYGMLSTSEKKKANQLNSQDAFLFRYFIENPEKEKKRVDEVEEELESIKKSRFYCYLCKLRDIKNKLR